MPRRLAALLLALVPLLAAAGDPDLSTPRRALRTFVSATERGEYDVAASALDLSHVAAEQRAVAGPRLARELAFVLDCQLWIDWDRISDEQRGGGGPPGLDDVGTLSAGAASVPLRLVRGVDGRWRIGAGVVTATPRLYQLYGPGWLGERLPPVLIELRVLDTHAWQWIGLVLAMVAAAGVGAGVGRAGHALARWHARLRRRPWNEQLARDVRAGASARRRRHVRRADGAVRANSAARSSARPEVT